MGGIENIVLARDQLFQAAHIIAHVAVGRRHHGGGPAHHMIAGEQRLFLLQGKTHVIGGVPGREDAPERGALAGDQIAVLDLHIGHEVAVAAFLDIVLGSDAWGP